MIKWRGLCLYNSQNSKWGVWVLFLQTLCGIDTDCWRLIQENAINTGKEFNLRITLVSVSKLSGRACWALSLEATFSWLFILIVTDDWLSGTWVIGWSCWVHLWDSFILYFSFSGIQKLITSPLALQRQNLVSLWFYVLAALLQFFWICSTIQPNSDCEYDCDMNWNENTTACFIFRGRRGEADAYQALSRLKPNYVIPL